MQAISETTSNQNDRTGRALSILTADVRRYLKDSHGRYRTDSSVLRHIRIPSALDGHHGAIMAVIREAKRRAGYRV